MEYIVKATNAKGNQCSYYTVDNEKSSDIKIGNPLLVKEVNGETLVFAVSEPFETSTEVLKMIQKMGTTIPLSSVTETELTKIQMHIYKSILQEAINVAEINSSEEYINKLSEDALMIHSAMEMFPF